VLKVSSKDILVIKSLACFELITHLEFATLTHPSFVLDSLIYAFQSHWIPYSLSMPSLPQVSFNWSCLQLTHLSSILFMLSVLPRRC